MELCKFLWAGAALVGIHITVPFMSMLLDHKVTPRKLLQVLPNLYKDLCSYPRKLTNIEDRGLPSLEPYFLHPQERNISLWCRRLQESREVPSHL